MRAALPIGQRDYQSTPGRNTVVVGRDTHAAKDGSLHTFKEHRCVGYGHLLPEGQRDGQEGVGMSSESGRPPRTTAEASALLQDACGLRKAQAGAASRMPDIVAKLSEAARFQNDFTAAVHALPNA
jgi:hypothetical protein